MKGEEGRRRKREKDTLVHRERQLQSKCVRVFHSYFSSSWSPQLAGRKRRGNENADTGNRKEKDKKGDGPLTSYTEQVSEERFSLSQCLVRRSAESAAGSFNPASFLMQPGTGEREEKGRERGQKIGKTHTSHVRALTTVNSRRIDLNSSANSEPKAHILSF